MIRSKKIQPGHRAIRLNDEESLMVSQELLEILRCPADVRNGPNAGVLDLVKDTWLVCRDCGRKYPIKNDIPIMLIEEGDKYKSTPVDQLGTPA
jgi:uncharacterized protein YbaR (Trm112 family)